MPFTPVIISRLARKSSYYWSILVKIVLV